MEYLRDAFSYLDELNARLEKIYADMADADVCKFKHGSPLLISYCKI